MRVIVCFLLLFGFNPNNTQVKFTDKDKFWLENEILSQVVGNNILIKNLETNQVSLRPLKNKNFNFDDYYNEIINDRVLFFEKSGGLVYELVHDTLIRIDNSYSHKLHNQSLNFNSKNIHYRFGGYGFFERSTSLIYYDFDNNEWDLKSNFENVLKNGYSDFTFHTTNNNILRFYGGHVSDEDGFSNVYVKDIVEINLNDNSLTRLGELTDDFPKIFRNYVSDSITTFLLKDPKTIFIYDQNKNSYFIYKTNKNPQHLIGIYNNRLYFYTHNTYERNNLKVNFIELDSIFYEESRSQSIFRNDNSTISLSLVLILLISILVLTFKKHPSSPKRLVISNDKLLNHKGEVILFSQEQIQLVLFIKQNDEVDNYSILELLGNNSYDLGHQNRVKNKLIKSVNDITFSRYGMNLILSKKNQSDKRSLQYFLNSDLL